MVQHEILTRTRHGARNKLIFDQPGTVAQWVFEQLPHVKNGFGSYSAIGIERAGRLIAGIVYHGFTVDDVQISMASTSPRWAERGVIVACLGAYPFQQLNVRRVTCVVPASLKRVHKFLLHLGFVEEGRHRYGFDLQTAVTFGLVREECRWLPLADQRQL